MNTVGMMYQHIMQRAEDGQSIQSNEAASDQENAFHNLLTNSNKGLGNMRFAAHDAESSHAMLQKNIRSDEINKILENASSDTEGMQALTTLMNRIAGRLSNTEEVNISPMKDDSFPLNSQMSSQKLSDPALQKQFAALYAKVEKLLTSLTDQKNISKTAPEFLNVLEQWSALAKQSNKQSSVLLESTALNSGKDQAIWKELVQSFQKRNQLAMKQQYNPDAKVTNKDVTNWLQHAIQNQAQLDKGMTQQGLTFTPSMPMSQVEQYVIHLNQANTQPVDHQLIEQFQKAMKTSRFLAMQNGTSQLNISLRPENLGDMMVKMTQINGEMTVKIVVSSAAAKEMLETNMHQLKNMFSPQQVVVEKQEANSQQSQTNQFEEDGQSMNDNNGQDQSGDADADQNDTAEDDFDLQLQEVLMNEKV